jgi:hypothetical protein
LAERAYNAEAKMRSTGGKLQHLHSFQPNLFSANCFKQPKPLVQEHRHDVNVEFIGKSSAQALLCGTCTTDNRNIFVACRHFGLTDGAFDTVSHKGKG